MSCPGMRGREFWLFLKKKAVSWDLSLGEASWDSNLDEASPVMVYGMCARLLRQWVEYKISELILSLKSHAEIGASSSPHVFSLWGWLSELTYFHFFSVICWAYLQKEISVILSTGNEFHFFFLFSVKPLCWCYLATALNQLSSSRHFIAN